MKSPNLIQLCLAIILTALSVDIHAFDHRDIPICHPPSEVDIYYRGDGQISLPQIRKSIKLPDKGWVSVRFSPKNWA